MTALPRDVPCPHCGAKIDHGCHSENNPFYSAKTHLARWRIVGVEKPTPEQRHADFEDGQKRDFEFRRSLFEGMRQISETWSGCA